MSSIRESGVRKSIVVYEEKLREVAGDALEVEVLREAYGAIVRDLLTFDEDRNWLPLLGGDASSAKGLTLADLKEVVPYLEKQTKILGDLLGRGLRLKNNHVFGRGFRMERKDGTDLQPRFQAIIDNPANQEALFSPTAMKMLNRIIFTSGNLLVMYDKKKKKFTRLSVDSSVENWLAEDDSPSQVKYILRTWEVRDDLTKQETTTKREWVPTSTYAASNPTYPATIKVGNKDVKVNKDAVVIFKAFNRDNGETWGVPDSFAAAAPAAVYADYMRSGAMLQHALAAISFVVKAKTVTAAKSAGAKLQNGRVAQAAITGPETEIQSMPRAGSVNLYEGRPLVARVASALDVSTTGITSDPGTGGSYASESALTAPEQMSALSRQEDFSDFFAEVFRVMGSADMVVNWNRLDSDPTHRIVQSMAILRQYGAINQQEMRDRGLELLDIDASTTELPQPDEFTGSKVSTLVADSIMGDLNYGNSEDPMPRQGNSGVVGSLDGDNSARDDDDDAGTA